MRMRRGLVLNLISNIMFFLSGYALHFFLGNSMPPAEYGVVGTILTVLDFEYMFVSNGARQSLASQISSGRYDIVDTVVKTIAFQFIVIAVFFCINFFGAPVFGVVFNDASLDFYFRVAGLLVIVNGLQVILLGINDGLQRFGTSALLGTFYPVAKLGTIPLILFVFQSDPVLGVEAGFTLAVLVTIAIGCVLLVANHAPFTVRKPERIRFGQIAHHTLSFSVFFIVVSLVLSFDTLIVKAVVEPSSMAGYYTGAMNFGKITYYLLQAFSTVILPVVAGLMSKGKSVEALQRIRGLLILAFAFILPISAIISASSASLLASFYSEDYAVAATALSCLSFSNFFMGMTVILNMVLNATQPSRFSDALSVISLVLVIPIFIVSASNGGITAIAVASASCTALMMLASFARIRQVVGKVMTRTAWVIICTCVVLWLLVHGIFAALDITGLLSIVVAYAVCYFAFLGALVAARILNLRELLALLK